MFIDELKIRGKTYGPRTFIYEAPHEWNKLLLFIRKSTNLSTFKSSRKTYLFKIFGGHPSSFMYLFYLDIYYTFIE